jgi:hypothetical protein
VSPRLLGLLLLLIGVAAFGVSLSTRDVPADDVEIVRSGPHQVEISRAVRTSAYDGMGWDDARLWLGLSIGFAASGLAVNVGVRGWRPRL